MVIFLLMHVSVARLGVGNMQTAFHHFLHFRYESNIKDNVPPPCDI